MHECACDRAGTGVEIFVSTPHREIHIPVMKRERHIADRMCKIESGGYAVSLRSGCDVFDIEQLTCEKIYAGKHHQCELIGVLLDETDNVFRSVCELAFARTSEN